MKNLLFFYKKLIGKLLYVTYNIEENLSVISMDEGLSMQMEEYVQILKALGDDIRFQIFEMLRHGSLCACKIHEKFDITQPTLSHHMKILCDSGIVLAEREGKWVHYSLNCDKLNALIAFLGCTKCNMHE